MAKEFLRVIRMITGYRGKPTNEYYLEPGATYGESDPLLNGLADFLIDTNRAAVIGSYEVDTEDAPPTPPATLPPGAPKTPALCLQTMTVAEIEERLHGVRDPDEPGDFDGLGDDDEFEDEDDADSEDESDDSPGDASGVQHDAIMGADNAPTAPKGKTELATKARPAPTGKKPGASKGNDNRRKRTAQG